MAKLQAFSNKVIKLRVVGNGIVLSIQLNPTVFEIIVTLNLYVNASILRKLNYSVKNSSS